MANNIHPSKIPSDMRVGVRAKMAQADRAKQFVPFDALVGLSDLLYEMAQQKEYVFPKDLADDQIMLLDEKFQSIRPGDMVAVDYIQDGVEQHVKGCVAKISEHDGYVQVVSTIIDFASIYELEIL